MFNKGDSIRIPIYIVAYHTIFVETGNIWDIKYSLSAEFINNKQKKTLYTNTVDQTFIILSILNSFFHTNNKLI